MSLRAVDTRQDGQTLRRRLNRQVKMPQSAVGGAFGYQGLAQDSLIAGVGAGNHMVKLLKRISGVPQSELDLCAQQQKLRVLRYCWRGQAAQPGSQLLPAALGKISTGYLLHEACRRVRAPAVQEVVDGSVVVSYL